MSPYFHLIGEQPPAPMQDFPWRRASSITPCGWIALIAAAGVFLSEMTPVTVPVAIGTAGLMSCFVSLILEFYRDGLSVGVALTATQCVALLFGAFGFYFRNDDGAVIVAVAGFLICIFAGFAVEIVGKIIETRALWRRWKARDR